MELCAREDLDTVASADRRLFCDLSTAEDEAAFFARVAHQLGVPTNDAAGAGARARIGRALAALGPTILVLDNVEQIIAEVQQAVATWLDQAPQGSDPLTESGASPH